MKEGDFIKKIIFKFLEKVYGKTNNINIRKILIKIIAKLDGGYSYSELIRKLLKDYHDIEIGYGTYGGCFKIDHIAPKTKIGRYCSIGSNIDIINTNHPSNYLTTHPIAYHPSYSFVKNDERKIIPLDIGNDVWIGINTTILANVKKIENGAIIAAGSVVTKDVPAYSIVAGVPAKVIKYRFDKETIKKIESTEWFNKSIEDLKPYIEHMKDVERFIEDFSIVKKNNKGE